MGLYGWETRNAAPLITSVAFLAWSSNNPLTPLNILKYECRYFITNPSISKRRKRQKLASINLNRGRSAWNEPLCMLHVFSSHAVIVEVARGIHWACYVAIMQILGYNFIIIANEFQSLVWSAHH